MRALLTLVTFLAFGSPLVAQLTDLQPGRNFPMAKVAFGGSFSEDVDMGDADNDGDLDVIVANGGNSTAEPNVIYINNGGVQGGTLGTFTDETATRLLGVPDDRSRDIEFVDLEGDGDLDIYVSNRGSNLTGQVSRTYTNQGGLQVGATGVYVESTVDFWGTLVSVDPASEAPLPGDGFGPWKDWSCDCDFADLDDDGDLDLFHSSYGANITGVEDSRVFLNDGDGRFDELWPWVNAGADIKLHTLDIDLVDLDGDYDVDVVASSRESQARVYRNNRADDGWTGDPFTDITQSALIDTGATQAGANNYGTEYVDADGDGDFDVWMVSYAGFGNRLLRNNGDLTFESMPAWIRADPIADDNEPDFLDYDSDGDIDAFVSNLGGTNYIYTSGMAQGVLPADGAFHRNGATGGGNLATWDEVPEVANAGSSLDGGAADMDNDGDPDALIVNDGGQQGRYWENALGVPDTHAPTFHDVTVQGDKADGSDTIIHAALRDNATYYVIDRYVPDLIYTVDGGAETCVRMTPMGSQCFRGVIPGALSGAVAYRVEVADDAGNVAVSGTTSYVQTSSSITPWMNLGCGTVGLDGVPYFSGRGDLAGGTTTTLALVDAAPGASCLLFLSLASNPAPFKGGTLYTLPVVLSLGLTVDDGGSLVFQLPWPVGVPSGAFIVWQYGIADATALGGVSLSNAAVSTAP